MVGAGPGGRRRGAKSVGALVLFLLVGAGCGREPVSLDGDGPTADLAGGTVSASATSRSTSPSTTSRNATSSTTTSVSAPSQEPPVTEPSPEETAVTVPEEATTAAPGVPTTTVAAGAQAAGVAEGSWDVTMTGSVSGRSFARSGVLRIVPTIATAGVTNGVNAVDVCLRSGFPAGIPEVGAIWLNSNSGCEAASSGADLDLGVVTVDGAVVTFAPDPQISATLANAFTSSDSVGFACPYAPVEGRMTVVVEGGQVSGTVAIGGYGGASCGSTTYDAEFSSD